MQWNEIESKWTQMRGAVREKWNKLTEEDLHAINGKRQFLLAKLQERYSLSREQAEKDVDAWQKGVTQPRTHATGGGV